MNPCGKFDLVVIKGFFGCIGSSLLQGCSPSKLTILELYQHIRIVFLNNNNKNLLLLLLLLLCISLATLRKCILSVPIEKAPSIKWHPIYIFRFQYLYLVFCLYSCVLVSFIFTFIQWLKSHHNIEQLGSFTR